jgi:hypothetical protein
MTEPHDGTSGPASDAPASDQVQVDHGDAVVPDADEAASVADLAPEDPPADAPATGDPDKKPAVAAPVPAHGEMASQEQLDEGEAAVEAGS